MSEKSSNFAGANVWAFVRMKVRIVRNKGVLTATIMLLSVVCTRAEQLPYLCDIGVQGGMGYYIGDAFNYDNLGQHNVHQRLREVYGLQFRYKFNNRWAIQVKSQYQKIDFTVDGYASPFTNDLINEDVVGEFNFFRYGEKTFDPRIKPITPYIFLGLGMAFSSNGLNPDGNPNRFSQCTMYFPFGIGMKWRFAPRWQMIVTWQHNLYFGDKLENYDEFGNTYDLNGSNFFNNDLTGQLTAGIVFEFAQQKGNCRRCNWN